MLARPSQWQPHHQCATSVTTAAKLLFLAKSRQDRGLAGLTSCGDPAVYSSLTQLANVCYLQSLTYLWRYKTSGLLQSEARDNVECRIIQPGLPEILAPIGSRYCTGGHSHDFYESRVHWTAPAYQNYCTSNKNYLIHCRLHCLQSEMKIQSNLAIRNFLVTLKLFLNAKSSLLQTLNQSTI